MADNFLTQLSKRAWETKGSRFNASRRLARSGTAVTLSITFASVYVVGLSVWSLTLADDTGLRQGIDIAVIVSSVLILALSVFVSRVGFAVRAYQCHECGKEMSALLDKIDMAVGLGDRTPDTLLELSNQYHQVIDRHSENHSQIDYLYFTSTTGEFKGSVWSRIRHCIAWHMTAWWSLSVVIALAGVILTWLL